MCPGMLPYLQTRFASANLWQGTPNLWFKSTPPFLLKVQSPIVMSDSALGPDGKLLDASEITWYHDKDDDTPLPSFTGASRPARRHIPSSRLTLDNSEVPKLKSHQAAIQAEQERLASLAKRNASDASLSDHTSAPATTNSSEDEQPKPAIPKGLPVFVLHLI